MKHLYMKALLITQCLQNDFVQPIQKHESIPNKLHIGHREAERLVGENIQEGPVCRLIQWAYDQPDEELDIIHIRDWHDAEDKTQTSHLEQFGTHCIKNTKGAEFVFQEHISNENHHIINASGLNDFIDTGLSDLLENHKDQSLKIGLIGVWTDAKISFLAYELATRYPNFRIALCSALTASSSTSMHFISLERLQKLLGITIFSSIADFTSFLNGSIPDASIALKSYGTSLNFNTEINTSESDKTLLQFLFRNCTSTDFTVLDGGFSGNVVLKSSSKDIYGHKEAPSVIKIGPRQSIAQERDAFERIKDVLGNNAPSIIDYAEDETRGAIKYRYAAMFGESVITLQKLYMTAYQADDIDNYLDIVFKEQLGKLYEARKSERLNLLSYYDFSSSYAASVKANVEKLAVIKNDFLHFEGIKTYNVVNFYEKELESLKEVGAGQSFMSYIHGDLNGANIMIDGQKNVWLIDFFHTHYGHVLKDLIKFENDLLFIFTAINNNEQFNEATQFIDSILAVEDLAFPPNEQTFKFEQFNRALRTVRKLRFFYPDLIETTRDPYQYLVAMLRYSIHTLSFDECNEYQKKLALYTASHCALKILHIHHQSKKLRLDFLNSEASFKGKDQIALTLLPGRKDMERDLIEDIETIKENGITHVFTLVTHEELRKHGVSNLVQSLKREGIICTHIPIKDQGIPTKEQINLLNQAIDNAINNQEKILIHCVGGLGRTGTIAALYLRYANGMDAEKAVNIVRNSRSQRAIESREQMSLVEGFDN